MSNIVTSINDLMEHTHTFKFTHPILGDNHTGSITIRSKNCKEYHYKQLAVSRSIRQLSEAKTVEEEIEIAKKLFDDTVRLAATLVVSWDEKFFGVECTIDNVILLLSRDDMMWLRDQIYQEAGKAENFFTVK